MRLEHKLGIVFLVMAGAAFTACNGNGTPAPATQTSVGLVLYQTAPPGPAGTALPTLGFPTIPPHATATPYTYTVLSGDTLSGIALKFGLTVENILAANPGLDPRFLSVGQVLTIPLGTDQLAGLPSPTPFSLRYDTPACYTTLASDLWCFVLAHNDHDHGLENLAAQIYLYDGGEIIAQAQAIPLLNLLPGGESAPLAVSFTGPFSAGVRARAQLLTALPVAADDTRYLPAVLSPPQVTLAASGLQAELAGQVALPAGSETAAVVWVVAVAYDDQGRVVGVRRWESAETLAAGDRLTYQFAVASLGPLIDQVHLLVEARP